MKCEDIQLQFGEYLESPGDYPEVENHLMTCSICADAFEDYTFITEGLIQGFSDLSLGDSIKNQGTIIARIARKRRFRKTWTSAASAAAMIALTFSTLHFLHQQSPVFSPDMLSSDYTAELIADGTIDLEISPSDDTILDYLVSSGDLDIALTYLTDNTKN